MRWDPVAGAAVYRVRLTEVDRNVVWQTLASEAGIRLPEEARAFMRDRKTLFWEITALDADGRVIASCEPEPFRVLERKP